jgi:hypothetical protein
MSVSVSLVTMTCTMHWESLITGDKGGVQCFVSSGKPYSSGISTRASEDPALTNFSLLASRVSLC